MTVSCSDCKGVFIVFEDKTNDIVYRIYSLVYFMILQCLTFVLAPPLVKNYNFLLLRWLLYCTVTISSMF